MTMKRAEYLSRRTEFTPRGEELGQSRLCDERVLAIRSAAVQRENLRHHIRENLSNQALADQHGVHIRTIEKVLQHESWAHVLPPRAAQ